MPSFGRHSAKGDRLECPAPSDACPEKNTCLPQLTGQLPLDYGAPHGFGDLRSVASRFVCRGGAKVWRRSPIHRRIGTAPCTDLLDSGRNRRRGRSHRSFRVGGNRGSKSRFIFRVAGPSPRSPFFLRPAKAFVSACRSNIHFTSMEIRSCHN